ncbi:dihydrolipoamide acetyltransferase family protein [Streptomyces sp. NPDC059740]|uniref:dihydrolipoamide acetyltransferase family protein n=1 Tax=Streptomyces sp. NPDC059740 TaxID=3346926 RepID=UPI00365221A0
MTAGVREFPLPDLGEGLTEATIVRWLVEVGDVVEVDQPVVEAETAKALVEVPCPYGGVVTARFGEEGAELPVGAVLLTVAVHSPGEGDGDGDGGGTGTGTGGRPAPAGTADARLPARDPDVPARSHEGEGEEAGSGSGNVLVGYGTSSGAAARRRRVRRPVVTGAAGMSGAAAGADAARSAASTTGPSADVRAAAGSGPADAGDGLRVPQGEGVPEAGGPVAVISPLVRRLAREHRIDLRDLSGSGPDGLVVRADVEQAIHRAASRSARPGPGAGLPAASGPSGAPGAPGAGSRLTTPAGAVPTATEGPGSVVSAGAGAAPAAAGASSPGRDVVTVNGHSPAPDAHLGRAGSRPPEAAGAGLHGTSGSDGVVRTPLRGVRAAVAEKVSRSRREIPDATCWTDADATALLELRSRLNADGGPKVSVLALLARVCTAALARFPALNGSVDPETGDILRFSTVSLGFAAQTDRGLVIPVVRDAQRRTVEGLSVELGRLTEAARSGTLTPAELTGGTFTLNNYGVFGVDGSTPILNHPEAAMLGVGRIADKPWVHDGELAVRKVVQLSLTFDHRVCDGGVAGGFLRFVADCVERPEVLIRAL